MFLINFLLPGSEKKTIIPVKFARLLTAFKRVSILSPFGKIWHVGLSMHKTNTYFTKGWPEFLKAHEIQQGYSMVFSHKGQSIFFVEIFDNTSCLKEYNGIAFGKRNAHREGCHDVSHDGSNSDDSYTGSEDESSAYINEKNGSESSYTSNEDYNSYDTELTATWDRKKTESHPPIQKKHACGTTSIRPRASGVGLRLRTTQQKLGLGATREKAILISDNPPVELTIPVAAKTRKRQVVPRRRVRVIVQGEPDSIMTKAVKRKEIPTASSLNM